MVELTGEKLWGYEIATDPTVPYGNIFITNAKWLVGSPSTHEALAAKPAEELEEIRAAIEKAFAEDEKRKAGNAQG